MTEFKKITYLEDCTRLNKHLEYLRRILYLVENDEGFDPKWVITEYKGTDDLRQRVLDAETKLSELLSHIHID